MIFRAVLLLALLAACTPASRRPELLSPPAPPAPRATRDEGANAAREPERPFDEARFTLIVRGNERRGTEIYVLRRVGQGFALEAQGEEEGRKTHALRLELDAALHVMRGEVTRGEARQELHPDGSLLRALGPGDAEERGDVNDLFIVPDLRASLALGCLVDPRAKRPLTAFPKASLRFEARGEEALPATLPDLYGDRTLRHVGMSLKSRLYEIACLGPHLVAARYPQQSAIVRDGFEALLPVLEARHWPRPATPRGLVAIERQVVVPASGQDAEAVLACTLLLPDPSVSPPPYPAVTFASGSGGQDRDENSIGVGGLKVSLFTVIAARLAEAGIASLRCDDRGIAGSIGSQAGITFETSARDVRSALDALAHEPSIDPKALAILGHSEGGLIAAELAAHGPTLRGLVLLASPGRRVDLTLREQVRAHRAAAGESAEAIEDADRKAAHLYDVVRVTGHFPRDLPVGQIEALSPLLAWLRSHLARDPEATARAIPRSTGVLVARGERDDQVFASDLESLRRALDVPGRARFSAITYPGLNHCFSAGPCEDPGRGVDEAFLGDVVTFLEASLAARSAPANGGHEQAQRSSSGASGASGRSAREPLRNAARSIP